MQTHTLKRLCEAIEKHGLKTELCGDAQREINSVATLEDAGEGQISFLSNRRMEISRRLIRQQRRRRISEFCLSLILLRPIFRGSWSTCQDL